MTQYPKLRVTIGLWLAFGVFLPVRDAGAALWAYIPGQTPTFAEGSLNGAGHSDIPPGWLMNRLDPSGQMGPAVRDPSVTLDPAAGHVREIYSQGGVEVRTPLVADVDAYSDLLSARTYRRLWGEQTRNSRSMARGNVKPKGMFHVELPFHVPKQLRGILGSGAPNIDVSGSETITLSGVSDWTVRPKGDFDTERARQSAFPSLEMKQDLQVNLTGSIGDKIKVDVDQSSNVQTSLDNKVKLRYEGDEDDMIKAIDLGNTNLSLQGASIRQEGLFGVKTVAKLGNVDLVTIASKQEGKTETSRFTPSGEKRQVRISDLDYIKRQYFFIADHPLVLESGSLRVYKDDRISSNNEKNATAVARLDPTAPRDSASNPELVGEFDILTQGDHYTIEYPYLVSGPDPNLRIPVIKMRYPLGTQEVLAVAYTEVVGGTGIPVGDPNAPDTLLLKIIKPPLEDFDTVEGGRIDPADPWYPVLPYELRNFYDLTARNIALETLSLKIRKREFGQSVDPDAVGAGPLVQVLGLDQQGKVVGEPPDGRIDDRFVASDEGILFFPDLHPFAPDMANKTKPTSLTCSAGFGGFLCLDDLTRNALQGDTLANENVYFTKTIDFTTQSRYYIEAEFKSSQQGYYLGRFNILENSEQVKVDNVLQKKGQDYNIDYETGQLTFSRPPGPDQVISVDYSFAPGVGQVQRTLLGFSTSYSPSADLSVSSSMLYESRGAQELNPKLGEEPARSMVGDVSSLVVLRPLWMTQLANMVPGVHTSAPSTLNMQGSIAVSMPNPNTQGEAYVDDMEGNRESNTLALGRLSWFWSSIPLNPSGQQISLLASDHAPVQWYNPRGVRERDLKPVLTNEEGGDNERPVLEINVLSPDPLASFPPNGWTGLTQNISRTGEDLSRIRFIEIWVNDRTQNHSLTKARLHIDFGRVSEDAFWQRDSLPNGLLDTEDVNGDTKLDFDEDTGLDGLDNEEEPGYAGPGSDPNGDDYAYDIDRASDYSKINGTENNSRGDANARPDTEDLDLDGRLDEDNIYFEATLDLSDTTYVAVDVALDYAGDPDVKDTNGWRLFRIPLDSLKAVGRPSWDDVRHARLWLDGMTGPINLQIGGIELVGSRWLAMPIPDPLKTRGVGFDVKVRNNKDDAAIYQPPFQVENAVGGNATRREQSLALAYTGVRAGDSLFAFKTYSDNATGIGYTQYRDIRLYVHGDLGVEAQNLRMLARFGPDTVNYYEYSLPVRTGWQDVRIPIEILSRLKEAGTERVKVDSITGADIGARYTVVGNPSFTRVNRIQFGVTLFGDSLGDSTRTGAGEVWIDELRLDGVRKDVGKTGNFTVQANFADLLALNVSYNKQDQDFFRVGSGVNRGSGLNHSALGLTSTLNLDRMLPLSGLQLPVRLTFQRSSDVPKYRTGSDVVLDDARSEVETRRADRQTIDFSYSRTGPRKGWTRWTIDAIRGNVLYTRTANVDPQSRDSSWLFNAGGSYDLPLGGGKGIPLSRNLRLKYLPDVVSLSMGWSATRSTSYSRFIQGTEDSTVLRSNVLSRLLSLGTSASYLPINGVTTRFSLSSRRDMLLYKQSSLGFNVGTEIDHSQQMELTWTPRRVLFLNPNISLSGGYRENAGPGVRINTTDPFGLKNIDNRGSARATTTIPLSRFSTRYQKPGAGRDTTGSNPLTAPFRFLLSRMQDIQTTFTFNRAASVTRVLGDPGFAFKTGFTQKVDPSISRASNSNIALSREFVSAANTSVQPFSRFTLDVRADHRLTFTDNAGVGPRRITTLSWPDLGGRWLQLHQTLGLEEAMSSLVVSSHYSLKQDKQGPQGKAIETHIRTTNWAPLLRWEASFKNGIRADVNSSVAKSEARDDRIGGVLTTHTTATHDIRFTKVYPASKGIRFPWSKKRVKLPNDLNLNLSANVYRDKSEVERIGFDPLTSIDSQRLTVGSGTTYNFTPSITGGFDLGFRQTKDYKTAVIQRGITVALNAQFRF